MQEKFEVVLEEKEQILLSFLPNRKKVWVGNLFVTILISLFVCGMALLAMFVPEEGVEPCEPIYALIPLGVFLLSLFLCIICTKLYLKNTCFVVTNERAIVRTGIFGVDFKSLDILTIGVTDVYVSIIDKILGGKTGSIRFGSMASPINGGNSVPFAFSNIVEPYKNYKLIKEQIEIAKKSNKTDF